VQLYTYFRSSAAYRVRIALNLKGLSPEMVSIHLQKQGGLNKKPEYRAVNPQMRVPALRLDSGEVLTQSLAIIEYLDEVVPEPPLLPRDPVERAKVRALAQLIACDIHPLNNTSPLRYLKNELGQDQAKIDAWYHHWVLEGFAAIETMVRAAPYAFGNAVRRCATSRTTSGRTKRKSMPGIITGFSRDSLQWKPWSVQRPMPSAMR